MTAGPNSEDGVPTPEIPDKGDETWQSVPLTEAEYNLVVPYIKKLQASHSTWHGAGYNCNSFGMDIAKFVGLDAPNPNMHVPRISSNCWRKPTKIARTIL